MSPDIHVGRNSLLYAKLFELRMVCYLRIFSFIKQTIYTPANIREHHGDVIEF